MKNTSKLILEVVNGLENYPLMFVNQNDFEALSTFLSGYLCAMEDVSEIPYNLYFSEWINNKGRKTSLVWTAYIFRILANEDEQLAIRLLIETVKEFITSIENEGIIANKSGPFATLEEAVKFNNDELMEVLKDVYLTQFSKR